MPFFAAFFGIRPPGIPAGLVALIEPPDLLHLPEVGERAEYRKNVGIYASARRVSGERNVVRRNAVWTIVGVGVWAGVCGAQDKPAAVPTMSIEAVTVNDIPIPNGPVKSVSIAVGDVITCKFYLRDWSPAGELLRAYQIKLDGDSFATGDQGVVQPVDFQMNPDKDPNAFIDDQDAEWVHRGRPSIPLVDTVSLGYRFLSVLLEPTDGPRSAQDGKKFTCGTLKLKPSLNAKGTFTIALVEDPANSNLISTANEPILPIDYERMTVEVGPTTRWRKVLSSDPPDGAVDARRVKSTGGASGSWDKITLRFNGDSSDLSVGDLSVEDGTPNPPKIKRVSGEGSSLQVEFDRGIRAGGWTTITHKSSHSKTRVGSFPGDANGDGKVEAEDVLVMIRALNGGEALPPYRADVDGSGALDAGDLLAVLDLVSAGSGPRARSSAASKK